MRVGLPGTVDREAEERLPYVKGVCNFCGTGCGHLLRVENGLCRGVFPSSGHPLSKGRLCVRGWHIHELLGSQDKIKTPLIREGGATRTLGLDEAVKTAAAALKRYSGDEIAFLASPRSSNEDNYLFAKMARTVFGSRNISLDSDGGHETSASILKAGTGWPAMTGSLEKLREAGLILVVGGDLTKQNPIIASEIHHAARAGARLVTISPRRTQMAKLSHVHLRPRPGTIGTLLEAVAVVMAGEKLIDADELARLTGGSTEFLAFLHEADADELIRTTGIEPAAVRSVARDIAVARSAYAFYATGVQSLDGRAMAMLMDLFLLAGKIGRGEGGLFPLTGISNLLGSYDMGCSPVFLPGYVRPEDDAARAGVEKAWGRPLDPCPGKSAVEALAAPNGSVKALVVVDHDSEIIPELERIKGLEFVLYFGAYGNPFSELAHMVLPLTTYIESDGTYTNSERRIQLAERKVGTDRLAMPLWEWANLISRELGRPWAYGSAAEVMKEIAGVVPFYAGINYDKLREHQGIKWPCDVGHPLGAEELEPAGSGPGFKFVPVPPAGTPAGDEVPGPDFPFRLTVGRTNYFWHCNNIMKKTFIPRREYNALLLLYPGGFVEMAPEDAKSLGFREKQKARVSSRSAHMDVEVRISKDILPGMVHVPYFIREMIPDFLSRQLRELEKNEEMSVAVKLEKAG